MSKSAEAQRLSPHRPLDWLPTASRSTILIVEGDPRIWECPALLLSETDYKVKSATDGPGALALLASKELRPDLVLADYNLPKGLTGVELSLCIQRELDLSLLSVILTGDIATEALRDIAQHGCILFSKPVKLRELTQAIAKLLAGTSLSPSPELAGASRIPRKFIVFGVDDDAQARDALVAVHEHEGRIVETFASCEAFLAVERDELDACLLLDAYLPWTTRLALLRQLRDEGPHLLTITSVILMVGAEGLVIDFQQRVPIAT